MRFISRITEEDYEAADMVYIKHQKQAGLYLKNDAKLIDCFWDNDRICYVFLRKETHELYEAWNNHTLV